MTSLFRNLMKENNRETAIKELLINTLSENAKEIQFECTENGKDCIELTDCTNSLCTTLEAIFLHGLKDSFLWQTMNVIAGDVDRRPEPSFWPILLVFLHKQVIENIHSLSQITTEIGYCRSWIRLSLNESLFSSYLNNIKKNSSALNPYYKKYALLKDSEQIDVASKIIQGVESCCQIDLPINSSLLNQWTNYALQLAGIWSPPLKSCPIASGIDVASSITNAVTIPTPKPVQTNEVFSDSIPNSPFKTTTVLGHSGGGGDGDGVGGDDNSGNNAADGDIGVEICSELNETEHLRALLQKVDEMGRIPEEGEDGENKAAATSKTKNVSSQTLNNRDKKSKKKRDIKLLSLDINSANAAAIGNSVMPQSGWSIHGDHDDNDDNADEDNNVMSSSNISESIITTPTGTTTTRTRTTQTMTNNCMTSSITTASESTTTNNFSRSNSMVQSTSSLRSPLDRHSYNTLLVRHEKTRELDWNDVWARFEGNVGVSGDIILTSSPSNADNSTEIEESLGFEVVAQTLSEKFSLPELQSMVEQMFQLAREKGLDSQGFVCKSCPHPLGVGFAPAQVCAFSGNYYCSACINLEPQLIPAKIIYNWDYHKYSVSKRAALFLLEFQNQPFIDLKLLNPKIYMASEEMSQLQALRIKLNFIRAYLFTCRESIIDELQKQVWPKEYLYEHIHQYSFGDLQMIQNRTLAQLLQKVVQFGEDHILNCRLCSVKGFICEVCNSPKVLYPFHIDTTFRCELCGAVFHANCLNDSQPCPKCERRRRREDLPLLEAVDNML